MTSARPDTRYLATSPITTDTGQRLTNLTVAAPGGYELNSARTAIEGTGSGRSIELIADIDDGQVGVLVDHDNGASYRISVTAGGIVVFSDATGTVASITAPNVNGVAKSYVVAWSTEPNPLSPATPRSEFLVYDVAGAALTQTVVEHAGTAASATGTFTVGGVFGGAAMTLAYSPTIDAVRISSRFHTRTETREHFVAQTAAPSIDGIAACQLFPVPAALLTAGNVAGPGYQLSAASMQTTRDRHRLLSPVVEWIHADPPALADDMKAAAAMNAKHVFDMGDGWQQPLMWLCRRMVPRHCQWLRVEVQWATYETVPGVTDLVELRAHTWNANPYTATADSNVTISRQADDTSMGIGVRQVFAPLLVERGPDGYTWIGLSARTDSGSGSGNATYKVRSITAVPWVLGEGYNGQPPNAWGP
jgi:hypothetical protein